MRNIKMLRYYYLLSLTLVHMVSSLNNHPNAVPMTFNMLNTERNRCFNPMILARNQTTNKITHDEFPTFLLALANEYNLNDPMFNVSKFSEFPDPIIIEFNNHVCPNPQDQCLNYLDVYGAVNPNSVSQATKDQLMGFCEDMKSIMVGLLGPSVRPSQAPSLSPFGNPSTEPSSSPFGSPSVSPSDNPSVSPSRKPSMMPSESPSRKPSKMPSMEPSYLPSQHPSLEPSSKPSLEHSPKPSSNPSQEPSSSPEMSPSSQPSPSSFTSKQPTRSPSKDPSSPPSTIPSSLPSNKPSPSPSTSPAPSMQPSEVRSYVTIPFGFANMYELTAEDIIYNAEGSLEVMQNAFDTFVQDVESNLYTQRIGRERRLGGVSTSDNGRILNTQTTFISNRVTNIRDVVCPDAIVNQFKNMSPAPQCQEMEGIITYVPVTSSAGESGLYSTESMIQSKAEEGISEGKMKDGIPPGLRDKYIVYSLHSSQTAIPVAAIAGVSIGAALFGLIVGRVLLKKKVRREKGRGDQYDGLNGAGNGSGEVTMEDDEYRSNSKEYNSSPTYRGLAEEALYRPDAHDMSLESSIASSSNAGSSGWSSSAGVSSLNTASVDSTEYFGSSLAAIGAASVITKRFNGRTSDMYPIVSDMDESSISDSDLGASVLETDDDESQMSPGRQRRQFAVREELYSAIKIRDWSLVGATAAIIAQSPADFLATDMSSTLSSGLSTLGNNALDNERCMELDRLVDLGDWEGVVLAAAKFEAESDRDGVTEGSASVSEGQRFLNNRSCDANSTNSPSVATNISESASNNLKRAEIRAEIEALVCRVVPDEIDNVDEMMRQFLGREEELVETLRTMQERSIAARQREAMRRNAKREARRMAKQNKLPPSGRPPALGKATTPLDTSFYSAASSAGNLDEESKLSITSKENQSNNSIMSPNRAALDYAIQIGDWEAVGRTAEQLGDGSLSEASEYHSADETSTLISSKSNSNSPDAKRSAELEGLIDRGDWSGVVAAASRFTASDNADPQVSNWGNRQTQNVTSNSITSENSWKLPLIGETSNNKSSHHDDTVSQSTEVKKENNLKEEEDALAQAEIWMTIAAQSKNENSNAAQGASDAADWAISRSLKEIVASSPTERQETQSITSSCDDTSV